MISRGQRLNRKAHFGQVSCFLEGIPVELRDARRLNSGRHFGRALTIVRSAGSDWCRRNHFEISSEAGRSEPTDSLGAQQTPSSRAFLPLPLVTCGGLHPFLLNIFKGHAMTVILDDDQAFTLIKRWDEGDFRKGSVSIMAVLYQLYDGRLRPADEAIPDGTDDPGTRPESQLKRRPSRRPSFWPHIAERVG